MNNPAELNGTLEDIPSIDHPPHEEFPSLETERKVVCALEPNKTVFSEYTYASDDSSLSDAVAAATAIPPPGQERIAGPVLSPPLVDECKSEEGADASQRHNVHVSVRSARLSVISKKTWNELKDDDLEFAHSGALKFSE